MNEERANEKTCEEEEEEEEEVKNDDGKALTESLVLIPKELRAHNECGQRKDELVLKGKRERRRAEFLVEADSRNRADDLGKKREILEKRTRKDGKGLRLREIERIKKRVEKINWKADILKLVHRLLYKTPGTFKTIKRDILEFNGFAFAVGEEERERELKRDFIQRCFKETVKEMLDIFCISKGGSGKEMNTKEAQVERILQFLEEPKLLEGDDGDDKNEEVAKKKKKNKKSTTATKKRKKGSSAAKKKPAASAGATKATAEVSKLKKQNADLKKKLDAALLKIEKLTGEKVERKEEDEEGEMKKGEEEEEEEEEE